MDQPPRKGIANRTLSPLPSGDAEQATGLETLPSFDLEYLYDDPEDPSLITVFPESLKHDISTNWITIDRESAVPLEAIR